MRTFLGVVILCGAIAALSNSAYAQSYQDYHGRPSEADTASPAAVNPYANAGAKIYVCDSNGQLWSVTLGTYKLQHIGGLGVVLTDIAFNPADGKLWGVSFSSFYTIDLSSGLATFYGQTNLNDINALVFAPSGIGYFEGFLSPELYTVNLTKGRYVGIGQTGKYESAGDLSWYNGYLTLSGYTGTLGRAPETIVRLNASNAHVLATAATDLTHLYGLATVGGNTFYGFDNSSLYLIRPSQKNISARTVLLKNFKSEGLGPVDGAAYKGDI